MSVQLTIHGKPSMPEVRSDRETAGNTGEKLIKRKLTAAKSCPAVLIRNMMNLIISEQISSWMHFIILFDSVSSLVIFPQDRLLVSNVTATGCKLSWEKSKDSGGLPLEYLIEKFCVASDAWSKQAVTSNTNFTVNDLGKYKNVANFLKILISTGYCRGGKRIRVQGFCWKRDRGVWTIDNRQAHPGQKPIL